MAAWQWSVPRALILAVMLMPMHLLMSRAQFIISRCLYSYFVSWKSTLTVSLDACFKLKLKDRSFKDPDLGTRLAYMVDDRKYALHLSKFPKDPPPEEVRWPAFICVTIINIIFLDTHLWFKPPCGERRPYQVISWLPCYWGRNFIVSACACSEQRCC